MNLGRVKIACGQSMELTTSVHFFYPSKLSADIRIHVYLYTYVSQSLDNPTAIRVALIPSIKNKKKRWHAIRFFYIRIQMPALVSPTSQNFSFFNYLRSKLQENRAKR